MHLKCIPRGTSTAESHPAPEGLLEAGSGVTDVKNIFSVF